MKRIFKLLATSTLCLAFAASAFAQSGSLRPYTYSTDPAKNPGFSTTDYESWEYLRVTSAGAQQSLPFRMLRPVGYSASAAYPLVIMLHGRGEAGNDNNYHLKWGGKEHLAAVKNKTFDGFVVFPQEPYGSWTNGPTYQADGSQPSIALTQVWDLVDSLARRFSIDRERVYIHGLSSGGTGVWASLYYRPDLFAAVQIMSAPGDVTQAYKISPTPLWLHQGGKDTNPVPSVSHNMMASLRNVGAVNTKTTRYSEYPEVVHTSWIQAYANSDFFPFFLRQSCKKIKVLGINPFPANGSVSLGTNAGMGAYQWYKDGVAIAGANGHRIDNINQPGTYVVMYQRRSTGAWITSEPLVLNVNNAANVAPAISFTSPMNTASFTAPATIKFRTSASDQDGVVSKVEFYNGSTLLFTTNYEPYDFTWSNVPVGNYQITAKVTDNAGASSSSVINVSVNNLSNQIPVVSMTAPADNSTISSSSLTLSASAWDSDGKIAKVDFYNGSTLIASKQWAPYNHYMYNVAPGTYTFVAVAYDDKGASKTSSPVNITVGSGSGNTGPNVSITSPANNSSYAAPANLTITASASDMDGVAKVEFFNGTSLIGTATATPYQVSWTNVPAGSYTIIAKATDAKGAARSSSGITITVGGAVSNQAPVTSITYPANNSTLPANTKYTVTATASDADGSVTKVEFYRGTTLLGTDTYPPYQYTVYTQEAGSFTFTTKAYDNQGAAKVSAPVTVTFSAGGGPSGSQDFFNLNTTCFSAGNTNTIELKPEFRANATRYAWWYTGKGLDMRPVAGETHKATLYVNSWITSGEVCVGVNYTTSPAYKQYCKPVNKCAQAREDNAVAESSILVDPSSDTYLIRAVKDITSINVVDLNGRILYSGTDLTAGQTLDFNQNLPNGVYVVSVHYSDGSREMKHMPKAK